MMAHGLIIAIDGYSSTGKSSFAKLLSKELHLLYLDSGALYRGVTLYAQENLYISSDNKISDDLKDALGSLELHFESDGKLYCGARCIEKEIRTMSVSSQVSPISTLSYVRNFVDGILHRLSKDGGVVMDGRDIGTTVFPHAQIKIFMTASDEVRAKRRYNELVSKGYSLSLEEVMNNLKERDYIDSHRDVSPLSRALDAFVLDNSDMTLKEEVEWAKGLIRGKMLLYD